MNEKIVYTGRIGFEPENITRKHDNQASWKKIAMVFLGGEVSDYYAWFLNKRFSLVLNKPLRGSHISFINDSNRDLMQNGRTLEQVNQCWNTVKAKWDGIEIPIMLNLNPRFDKTHWWLNVDHDYRDRLHGIRSELGLGKPYYGLHMSLGYANEKTLAHHEYITRNIINGLIP